MDTKVKSTWHEGHPAIGIWSTIDNELVLEALSASGADYICLDMQHGNHCLGTISRMIHAAGCHGTTVMVRVKSNSPVEIGKVLDAGANGVIVPMVNTALDARQALNACLYPPRGVRSFGPYRKALGQALDIKAVEDVLCFIMIETDEGLAHVEEIASIDGITGLYIGPNDLSLGLGLGGLSFENEILNKAIEKIKLTADAENIVAGIHTYDAKVATKYLRRGFTLVTAAVDLRIVVGQAREIVQSATEGIGG